MKKEKYIVSIYVQRPGYVEVEASSKKEAVEKVAESNIDILNVKHADMDFEKISHVVSVRKVKQKAAMAEV